MSHFIRRRHQRRWLVHEGLLWTLRPSAGDLKTYQRRRFSRLTAPQRAAVLAFVELVEAPEPDLVPWRRVVEAGDVADWFRRFY